MDNKDIGAGGSLMTTLREQFLHPPSEFTPIPFWFWNDKLTHEEIKRQIHQFYEKGIEG